MFSECLNISSKTSAGILLLGEVLKHIESKPLGSETIHSLVGFFKDRLVSITCLAFLCSSFENFLINGFLIPSFCS